MKKYAAALILLLALMTAISASALELETGTVRAFADNELTIRTETGGTLTVEAASGTLPLENPVTDLAVPAGETTVTWNGLTFGGEPLQPGSLTLRAVLKREDGTAEETEIRTQIYSPMPAMLCCLPAAQSFYADGKNILKIECAVSNAGTFEISVSPKGQPEEEVWHARTVYEGRAPMVFRWDGRGKDRKPCPPGEYVISAWSSFRSQYVQQAEITLTEEPLPEPELAVTGSLIPEDLTDDAAVWAALTAPVAVGDGPEGKGLILMESKAPRAGKAGTFSCRTTGIAILEICDDGWVKAAGWRQLDGAYTEGYVKADKLRMIRPNARYGAVVDKRDQTITVYENGKRLGTALVSTGLTTETSRAADTHSGVFLLGTRLGSFVTEGHTYCYPIRIDCLNLIHQMGYVAEASGRNFDAELATLGTKASHGCIRVDARITEESGGINSWWIWTHMGHDAKIIVIPDE